MLNVAITFLFVVICVFQPWMAVIFGLLWLVEMKYKQMERGRQEGVQQLQDDFEKKANTIIEDFNKSIEDQPERKPKKVHLRIVK